MDLQMGKLSQGHTPSFPDSYLLHLFSNKKPHSTHLWEHYLWLPHLIFTTDLWVGHIIPLCSRGNWWSSACPRHTARKEGLHSNLGPLRLCGPSCPLFQSCVGVQGREFREGLIQEYPTYEGQTFVVTGSILDRGTTLLPDDALSLKLSLWWKQHFNFQDSNKMARVLTTTAMHAYEFSLSTCICIAVSSFVAINTMAFW